MQDLSKHIKEEEADDLPALEKVLKAGDSEDMARSFQRTKKFVPSRSHPMAPARFVIPLLTSSFSPSILRNKPKTTVRNGRRPNASSNRQVSRYFQEIPGR